MTDAFTFTPDAGFIERELDAELNRDSRDREAAERAIRTMLIALDGSLAGISDAREELRPLYADSDVSALTGVLEDEICDQDIAAHLEDAARNLRAAAAILRGYLHRDAPTRP